MAKSPATLTIASSSYQWRQLIVPMSVSSTGTESKKIQVEITVDWDRLFLGIGQRAAKSKNGLSSHMDGAVRAKRVGGKR